VTTLLSILAGLALPTLYMLTIRLHQCRCCLCRGHAWERFQIEVTHYRDPAALPFRMCKRCGHHEILEPNAGVVHMAPTALGIFGKPRPTPLPSDGRSFPR